MNLLHIVYAKVWGGGEQYVYTLCKEEKARGHRNIVVLDKKQKKMMAKFQEVATVGFYTEVPRVCGTKRTE